MIEHGVDLIKDIKRTRKEDRPWVINIIVTALCIALCTTTFFIFSAQKSQAVQDKIKAEAALYSLQVLFVTEGKECPGLILAATEQRDLYWSAKFDNQQLKFDATIEALTKQANSLKLDFTQLVKETKRVKNEVKTVKSTVNMK